MKTETKIWRVRKREMVRIRFSTPSPTFRPSRETRLLRVRSFEWLCLRNSREKTRAMVKTIFQLLEFRVQMSRLNPREILLHRQRHGRRKREIAPYVSLRIIFRVIKMRPQWAETAFTQSVSFVRNLYEEEIRPRHTPDPIR